MAITERMDIPTIPTTTRTILVTRPTPATLMALTIARHPDTAPLMIRLTRRRMIPVRRAIPKGIFHRQRPALTEPTANGTTSATALLRSCAPHRLKRLHVLKRTSRRALTALPQPTVSGITSANKPHRSFAFLRLNPCQPLGRTSRRALTAPPRRTASGITSAHNPLRSCASLRPKRRPVLRRTSRQAFTAFPWLTAVDAGTRRGNWSPA